MQTSKDFSFPQSHRDELNEVLDDFFKTITSAHAVEHLTNIGNRYNALIVNEGSPAHELADCVFVHTHIIQLIVKVSAIRDKEVYYG